MAMCRNPAFKVLLVGDSGVGKSAILSRFTEGTFSSSYLNTIGIDYAVKAVEFEGRKIDLKIWDTAGQERYRAVTTSYYRGSHGVLIVYDITDAKSFENSKKWVAEVFRYTEEGTVIILVGNKADLIDRAVHWDTAEEFAEGIGVSLVETSAKSARGITELFAAVTMKMVTKASSEGKIGDEGADDQNRPTLTFREKEQDGDERNCC